MQRTSTKGFTVPELLVAIVVSTIILVGIMAILVNLSSNGASTIAESNQIRKAQSAMATIKQDVTYTTDFLIAPAITDADVAASPTGTWKHTGGGAGKRTLLLQQQATDLPRQDPATAVVYRQSGGCPLGYAPVYINVIYYLKDKTLYRRSLIPPAVPGDPYCNSVSTLGQIQTCRTPGTPTVCTQKDTIIAEDITAFDVAYYTNPADTNPAVNGSGVQIAYDTGTPITQTTMSNLASIRITLKNEASIDGTIKEYSSSLRLMRANF